MVKVMYWRTFPRINEDNDSGQDIWFKIPPCMQVGNRIRSKVRFFSRHMNLVIPYAVHDHRQECLR